MGYNSLEKCINDLESNNHLVRINKEVDSHLEMSAIHLRVCEVGGPAILFTNVKNSKFRAVSNLFGTLERSKFIFRDSLHKISKLIEIKKNPSLVFKNPIRGLESLLSLINFIPKKSFYNKILHNRMSIGDLPQIKSWPMDGGAFITLPQVYTENQLAPSLSNSNLGMYRIQISGNQYIKNKEVGLHYQTHRGIGIHQSIANELKEPLKVSVFIGGPPAHSLSAVMPLPEGMSEINFAGILGNRRFRYTRYKGHLVSSEADFVITGIVHPNKTKIEGPFGDHLGYYSLKHPFPVMEVKDVYYKKNAIFPFTVVGRPPQEDTSFGKLIHEITGSYLQKEIPGLHELNAVDAAGIHPLLFAIGSERYTPYLETKRPQEILTIANHILGTGQLSLAKYLFIIAKPSRLKISTKNEKEFFLYVLQRVNFSRDLHFITNTTIDTLDYSGEDLHRGSKLIVSVCGDPIRKLSSTLPSDFSLPKEFKNPQIIMPGVVAISTSKKHIRNDLEELKEKLAHYPVFSTENDIPLIVLVDNSSFTKKSMKNFLWETFTRSNPASDIHGILEYVKNKHWGCKGSLIIDARTKSHHAPILEKDSKIEKKVDNLGCKGGPLYGII